MELICAYYALGMRIVPSFAQKYKLDVYIIEKFKNLNGMIVE